MAPVGESVGGDAATGMGDEAAAAAAAGGPGAKKGSYVPPALRGDRTGAAAAGASPGSKYGERDDFATLRVTNVSPQFTFPGKEDLGERILLLTVTFTIGFRDG